MWWYRSRQTSILCHQCVMLDHRCSSLMYDRTSVLLAKPLTSVSWCFVIKVNSVISPRLVLCVLRQLMRKLISRAQERFGSGVLRFLITYMVRVAVELSSGRKLQFLNRKPHICEEIIVAPSFEFCFEIFQNGDFQPQIWYFWNKFLVRMYKVTIFSSFIFVYMIIRQIVIFCTRVDLAFSTKVFTINALSHNCRSAKLLGTLNRHNYGVLNYNVDFFDWLIDRLKAFAAAAQSINCIHVRTLCA